MKKMPALLSAVLIIAVLATFGACSRSANKGRTVNSVSHRGYYTAPENTLSAYRMSAEKGFTMVETDVRFTKDGVAVLLHDGTVDRTSNGHGNISDMTFEQVSALDFGSWKGERFAGEKVPRYTEFIDLCKSLNLYPYIEIKNGATKEQVESIVKVVQDNGMTVTWIARNAEFLVQAYTLRCGTEYGDDDRYGLIVDVITQDSIDSVSKIDKSKAFIDADYLFLTGAQIRLCKKNEIALEVWTLDDERQIANVDPYITGVTSNKYKATEVFENIQ